MALYRTYRPQTLSELDSQILATRLKTVFSSSMTPHALLFAGPKGTGKTSTARIVAKILNCELRVKSKTHVEPCNRCESCLSITEGRNMDVIEVDAASNRGIDEIRELREKIKLAPVSSQFKVYIIDEVHMLTNEAFNALLKTLEEPPAHAVFILATTEADKLPETILSRCMKFMFKRATIEEVIHSLERVAAGEKLKVQREVLAQIAEYADGSFRDATKMLEQATAEGAVTPESIEKLFGFTSKHTSSLFVSLQKKDSKAALTLLQDLTSQGTDMKLLVTEILNELHAALLSQYGVTNDKPVKVTFKASEITALIKLFSRVFIELKSAHNPVIPVEVAVVEWCEKI